MCDFFPSKSIEEQQKKHDEEMAKKQEEAKKKAAELAEAKEKAAAIQRAASATSPLQQWSGDRQGDPSGAPGGPWRFTRRSLGGPSGPEGCWGVPGVSWEILGGH